ncbi:HPF/RaiA family ribosome-associated protein [Actibacterium sp. D379-3]
MQTEPQVTFRGLDASPALTALIREKVEKLEQFHHRITSCRVTIELPHRHGHKGHLYEVAVEMEVPGGTVIVNRKPGNIHGHEDVKVAIHDSFDAARRQLEDHVRKTGGQHVKAHPEKLHGPVVRLWPDEGYGFIQVEGRGEVYFQRDSVVGTDWDRLDLETDLEFSLMDGEKGPFAVNVSLRG